MSLQRLFFWSAALITVTQVQAMDEGYPSRSHQSPDAIPPQSMGNQPQQQDPLANVRAEKPWLLKEIEEVRQEILGEIEGGGNIDIMKLNRECQEIIQKLNQLKKMTPSNSPVQAKLSSVAQNIENVRQKLLGVMESGDKIDHIELNGICQSSISILNTI